MFGGVEDVLVLSQRAISSVSGLPKWLQIIAPIDPFTYAVRGFKAILLKDGGFTAIRFDLLFLFSFGIAALALATPLFKRTL